MLLLILMLFESQRVEADGSLEIRFVQYIDVTLGLEDGRCCSASCSESCVNYFDVCFEANLKGSCASPTTTGNFLTETHPSGIGSFKDFTVGEDLGNGLTNPVSLNFSGAWSGELNLTFIVWNSTNPPEKITSLHYNNPFASHGNLSSIIAINNVVFGNFLYFAWQVKCADYFYGEDCSIYCVPMDDTSGHYICSSNGTKICLLGWKYPHNNCTTNIDFCLSNPCQNRGTCTHGVVEFSCSCFNGYTGDTCETEVNMCASNPCQNGGICQDYVNYYECNCSSGYAGKRCEHEISECSSLPCLNGSHCIDLLDGYTCECVGGYTGTHWGEKIRVCASSPCRNGGICVDQISAHMCLCGSCYTGIHCEMRLDSCLTTDGGDQSSVTCDVGVSAATIAASVVTSAVLAVLLTIAIVLYMLHKFGLLKYRSKTDQATTECKDHPSTLGVQDLQAFAITIPNEAYVSRGEPTSDIVYEDLESVARESGST